MVVVPFVFVDVVAVIVVGCGVGGVGVGFVGLACFPALMVELLLLVSNSITFVSSVMMFWSLLLVGMLLM